MVTFTTNSHEHHDHDEIDEGSHATHWRIVACAREGVVGAEGLEPSLEAV